MTVEHSSSEVCDRHGQGRRGRRRARTHPAQGASGTDDPGRPELIEKLLHGADPARLQQQAKWSASRRPTRTSWPSSAELHPRDHAGERAHHLCDRLAATLVTAKDKMMACVVTTRASEPTGAGHTTTATRRSGSNAYTDTSASLPHDDVTQAPNRNRSDPGIEPRARGLRSFPRAGRSRSRRSPAACRALACSCLRGPRRRAGGSPP